MMNFLNAQERTLREFRDVLDISGWKVTHLYRTDSSGVQSPLLVAIPQDYKEMDRTYEAPPAVFEPLPNGDPSLVVKLGSPPAVAELEDEPTHTSPSFRQEIEVY